MSLLDDARAIYMTSGSSLEPRNCFGGDDDDDGVIEGIQVCETFLFREYGD